MRTIGALWRGSDCVVCADVRRRAERRHNPNHDSHGKFSSGPSGGGSEQDDFEDVDVEPVVIASAHGGGRQVSAYADPTGIDPVAIAVSEHGHKMKSIDDAEQQFSVEQSRAVADGLDQMAHVGREAPTPDGPHAFDDGPVVLGSVEGAGLRVTAFHDGGGDLLNEGERFIQVSDSHSDWSDSLRGATEGRLLNVGLGDAIGLASALREVANH